jgi:polyhydroxyalkanoate synthesis regulator phasin
MEEIAGLIEQMVQEGDLDEETAAAVLAEMQGGMGEDNMPSMEEVVQLLDAMVSAGELDEETAAGIVEEIASGGAMADQGGMIAEASADDLFNALVRV